MRRPPPALLAILLIAAWLRLTALTADVRFHGDEALFATFARSAALNGEWMLPGALDKPPLALYSMALAMLPFTTSRPDGLPELTARSGEIAARLPGMLASLLLVPLVYGLAWRLYRQQSSAVLAALLIAISPFTAAFGATAFTDGLMLLLTTLALYAIVRGQWEWAGTALALGFAAKQQALYALPLVIGLGWLLHDLTPSRLLRFAAALGAGMTVLLLWDSLRGRETSIFALALANNDPARLIRSDEVLPRLAHWVQLMASVYTPMSALFIPAAVGGIFWRWRYGISRNLLIDLLLALYIVAYLLLHWLVAFNIYDRYLLLIVVPLALLTARGLISVSEALIGKLAWAEIRLVGLLFAAAIVVSAFDAAQGRLAIGINSESLSEIDALADELNALPLGTIIYDHWLGWELGYYLGQWTDKRRVYYPTPRALAEDALRQPDPAPRYLVVPRWVQARPWLEALDDAGFMPRVEWQRTGFLVYRLLPP